MTQMSLNDLYLINRTGYLVVLCLFPPVLGFFWFTWCRERIAILGILASGFLTVLYFLSSGFLFYGMGDPGVLTAFQAIGIIEQGSAAKALVNSKFFQVNDENSWRMLSLINPGWKKQTGLIEQEELISLLERTQSIEIGRHAAAMLDESMPGWRNGLAGERIGSRIIGRLSEAIGQTDSNQELLRYFSSLELEPNIPIEYLAERTRDPGVGAQVAALLDSLSPDWRQKEDMGGRVGRSIVGCLSSGDKLTEDDRKHLKYLHGIKLGTNELIEYLAARARGAAMVREIGALLDTLAPGWRSSDLGKHLGQSILERLSTGQKLTADDRFNLLSLEALGFDAKSQDFLGKFSSLMPLKRYDWKLIMPKNVVLSMKWISPGRFTMGNAKNRSDHFDRQHAVELTQGYWIGIYEVTQEQWMTIMGNNPSAFKDSDKHAPVDRVSWVQAVTFCNKLTAAEHASGRLPDGYEYGLPTEAQWEYACQAEFDSVLADDSSTTNLERSAWFLGNSKSRTHPVGEKRPNRWGLYDMLGNVWEWCNDLYGAYPEGFVKNPLGEPSGVNHVCRGGDWESLNRECSPTYRNYFEPKYKSNGLGFRLALRPVL
jgi:formylglycine-generating enzyme required for sulfatase activity